MTRRLVKEGEGFISVIADNKIMNQKVFSINFKKETTKVKWQVGRKYAVCVNGKQVWYCPKCLSYSNEKEKKFVNLDLDTLDFLCLLRLLEYEKKNY